MARELLAHQIRAQVLGLELVHSQGLIAMHFVFQIYNWRQDRAYVLPRDKITINKIQEIARWLGLNNLRGGCVMCTPSIRKKARRLLQGQYVKNVFDLSHIFKAIGC